MPDRNQNKLRWLLVLPALIIPLFASLFYFIWFSGTTFGKATYVGTKVFTLLWPFIAVKWILKENFFDDPRPIKRRESLIIGTVFGILTTVVMIVMYLYTPPGEMIRDNAEVIVKKIDELGVQKYFILFAIFISFAHSALEEFFWRLFGFGQMRKLVSVAMAILIAAIGFSLHHIVVLSEYVSLPLAFMFGACVGLGGAVWSWIYHRTNSLLGAWISHMIVDLGIMWIGWDLLSKV